MREKGTIVNQISVMGILHARRTDCRNRSDDFTQLELVQNGRLSGSVEADLLCSMSFYLLLPKELSLLYHKNT